MGTGARHHADLVQQLILYYLISELVRVYSKITHAQLITASATTHYPY
jgi:hypothetical protein